VERRLLYTWKNRLLGSPEPRQANLALQPAEREAGKLREENQRLKEALGEKALEADFFRSALRRIKEGRPNNTASGDFAFTRKSRRGRNSGKAN
jgi:hypothetical protein